MTRGKFITFEGGEGAGKSTQCRLLADRLAAAGIGAELTREPGGTEGADAIRQLLIDGPTDRWDAETETLLHFAARRDHLVRRIGPALERGDWVVCDRFTDSTVAYQGYGYGLGADYVRRVEALAVPAIRPDLTLILDFDPALGLARAEARGEDTSRYERLDIGFHRRLRDGFLEIAAAEPERCVVLDADEAVEQVAEAVWTAVGARLKLPA